MMATIGLRQIEASLGGNGREGVFASFQSLLGGAAKRAFDILLASFGLIVLFPLLVIVGVLIVRDSPGPVFYHGLRIGRGGQPFRILKFRTMYERPESHKGPRLTCRDDPRITPFGRWLRNTKINELPQLWNVLRGDMSFVGPRPEDPAIIDSYPPSIRNEILFVRPGITSPASVLYHNEEELLAGGKLMGTYIKEILPDKLRLDQLYVRNRSFTSDLDTIFWTLSILTPQAAKARIPEGYLFAGPLFRIIHRHASWFVCDFLVALSAVSVASLIWRIRGPLNWGWENIALFSFCLAFIFSLINYLGGLHRIIWSRASAEDAIGLFFASGAVTLLALLLNQVQTALRWLSFPPLPFELILCIGLMAQCGFIFARYRFRLLTWLTRGWMRQGMRGLGERVVILGDGEASEIANWLLRRDVFGHAFSIIGIVATEDPTIQGMRLDGSKVLGGIGDLPSIIKRYDVGVIVHTPSGMPKHLRDMVFDLADKSGVKLVCLDDLLAYLNKNGNRPAESADYLEWHQQRVNSQPLHDSLTKLPDGSLLQERLQHSLAHAKRYKTTPALLSIELEGLSPVDSAPGRRTTEEVLKEVARRLATCTREADTLSRSDLKEFTILFDDLANDEAAETVLRRTKALLARPFAVRERELIVDSRIHLYVPVGSQIQTQKAEHCDLSQYCIYPKGGRPAVASEMTVMNFLQ